MSPYLALTSQARSKVIGLVDLLNSRNLDAFLPHHAEDVIFSTPVVRSISPQSWGRGRAALGNDAVRFRETFGPVTLVDVLPAGNSISLLFDPKRGGRTQLCLEFGDKGLVTRVFAFEIGSAPLNIRG